MNTLNKIGLSLLIISLLAPALALASAGTATAVSKAWIGVDIGDTSGTAPLDATVYVYWDGVNPSDGTVDITIVDPTGSVIHTWANQAPTQSGVNSFKVTVEGDYIAILEGSPSYSIVTKLVASASISVIPESMIGSLAVLGAGFAAAGAIGIIKRKHP